MMRLFKACPLYIVTGLLLLFAVLFLFPAPARAQSPDVDALTELISTLKQKGAKVDTEIFTSEQYEFDSDGYYLLGIYWGGCAIEGSLALHGFEHLELLDLTDNKITALTLHDLPRLKVLQCGDNRIKSLDISGLPDLRELLCYRNKLKTLQLGNSGKLLHLDCMDNALNELDLSGQTKLASLVISANQLEGTLNLTGHKDLEEFICYKNKLTELNIEGLEWLLTFNCDNNLLTELQLTGLATLEFLDCSENGLTALNLSDCTQLTTLICRDNALTSLDTTALIHLQDLFCKGNPLEGEDLQYAPSTAYVDVRDDAAPPTTGGARSSQGILLVCMAFAAFLLMCKLPHHSTFSSPSGGKYRCS